MNISILTISSRGNVQPFVALGKRLKEAGHAVRIGPDAGLEPTGHYNPGMCTRCQSISQKIQAEDSIQNAISVIENTFKAFLRENKRILACAAVSHDQSQ